MVGGDPEGLIGSLVLKKGRPTSVVGEAVVERGEAVDEDGFEVLVGCSWRSVWRVRAGRQER